eukprot:TRINITY_DN65131_c0_g1_i1.p1 TRINITY_DN65131_c0_g1~~TRINITY_DN65131_c0_g1_i1.p1  ORF type:complete len:515 (+),score=84.92 TRINITY_DN65131_c0_g1_i1:158-1702(+)
MTQLIRLLRSLLCGILGIGARADIGDHEECLAAYERTKATLVFDLSGATTRYTPSSHRSAGYIDFLKSMIRQVPKEFSDGLEGIGAERDEEEDTTVSSIMYYANNQAIHCLNNAGRYWEVEVATANYSQWLMSTDIEAEFPTLNKEQFVNTQEMLIHLFERHGTVPNTVRSGLCAPKICSKDAIVAELIPRFVAILTSKITEKLEPPPPDGMSQAVELAPWSAFDVDFIITGMDTCGTTSLHRNLERHPKIELCNNLGSSDSFFDDLKRHILPPREQVNMWKADCERKLIHKGLTGPISKDRRSFRLGLRQSMLFQLSHARMAMSLMPNLKVILVSCDPLGRVEKLFFRYLYCGSAGTDEQGWRPEGAECINSISQLQHLPQVLSHFSSSAALQKMSNIFIHRLIYLHQSRLEESPTETYNSIAKDLSAGPFPDGFAFYRYNSRRGNRTDLCHNRSVVFRLQRMLQEEYRAMELVHMARGLPPPIRLRSRQTRCSRQAELVPDRSCDWYGRCNY